MNQNNIKKDVMIEFSNLKSTLQQTYLKPGFNVDQTKNFLKTHIPKEIVYKTEVLLDTQLNYLMADARERIKGADIQLQNAFFDADFRKRVHEWTKQLENKIALEPDIVRYLHDRQLKQSLILSGLNFILGTVTVNVVLGIVAGIVTILLSAYAFGFYLNQEKARESIQIDIDKYLASAQEQVLQWLEKVGIAFESDFHHFCSTHGFILEGKSNE
ncbi:hypothetical protein [Thiofilum flexile]|uniref:hypothetical protein n=1 Tax=Thiofilum flexile TaxID=125627 RepID=UPI000379DF5C|nr:hypothetical protein [Thiofilum flexile]